MTILEAFAGLGKWVQWLISIAAIVFVALVAAWIVARIWPEKPEPPPAVNTPNVPVTEKPSISRNDSSVPDPKKEQAGRTELSIPDTVKEGEVPGTVKWIPVTIIHNADPSKPPLVFAGGRYIQASYQEIRDPYVSIESHLHFGATASIPTELSVWFGWSPVAIFNRFNLGLGTDFSGAGVFGAYRFYEILEVAGQWNVVHYKPGPDVRAGLALRF